MSSHEDNFSGYENSGNENSDSETEDGREKKRIMVGDEKEGGGEEEGKEKKGKQVRDDKKKSKNKSKKEKEMDIPKGKRGRSRSLPPPPPSTSSITSGNGPEEIRTKVGRPRSTSSTPSSTLATDKALTLKKNQEAAAAQKVREAKAGRVMEEIGQQKGEKLSKERARSALLLVAKLLETRQADTEGAAKSLAAELMQLAPHQVRALWESAEKIGAAATVKEVGKKEDHRGGHTYKFCEEHYLPLDKLIQTELVHNELYITAAGIKELISIHFLVDVSIRTCRRVLKRLGYTYGKLRKSYVVTNRRKRRIELWMVQYAEALKLQEEGTHVIVYTDESYANTKHARTMGYTVSHNGGITTNGVRVYPGYCEDSDDDDDDDDDDDEEEEEEGEEEEEEGGEVEEEERRGDSTNSKGPRLILLHAITKDGFLCQDDLRDTRRGLKATAKYADYESAEWVFQSDARVKDYHKNMDNDMFMNWVEHILTPSFKAKYPGKKMILIIDNAPYHHALPDKALSIGKANKTKLVAIAKDIGLKTFKCTRDLDDGSVEKTFSEAQFVNRAGGTPTSGPYVAELRKAVMKYAKEKCPDRLMSNLELFFDKPDNEGWQILYTPPYCPKFQPIERVWGYTKNGVALEYKATRTIPQLQEDVMTMWYGGVGAKTGNLKGGLTAELVRSFIAGSERDMNDWITRYGRSVQGTVAALEEGDKEYPNSDPERSEDELESDDDSDEDDLEE